MENEKLKMKKIYGMELILELFGCDLKILTSEEKIRQFIIEVSKRVELKTYGPAHIKRFMGGGRFGMGYSFLQFLSASSMAGHFIEKDKIAFINIFSCNTFDSDRVVNFAQKFFKAKKIKKKLIIH